MQHFREGEIFPVNPFNLKKSSNPVIFDNEHIRIMVFWTKNTSPMIKYLPEIDRREIPYYFLYTVTAYGKEIEPNIPHLSRRITEFCRLSDTIGPEKVILRYDPIFFSARYTPEWHLKHFEYILRRLRGYSTRVIISFYTPYRKTYRRMEEAAGIALKEKSAVYSQIPKQFIPEMLSIAENSDFSMQSCAETLPVAQYGVRPGACIDAELIRQLTSESNLVKKDQSQRAECLCAKSVDIGLYDTCKGGCKYCYATR